MPFGWLMKACLWLSPGNNYLIALIFFTLIIQILLCLIFGIKQHKNMLKQATTMPLDANSPTILVKIVNYIHTNFATTRTLEQICSHFGISRSQLTRLFTTHIGITPYAYLQNFKLSHAKQRLSQGASVTEACFESGFSDYSNFIQLFRKTVGISPLTYKKQHYGSTALIDTTD